MTQNILIGLDDSLSSEAALELGIHWAQRTGARLTGLAILDESALRRAEPAPLRLSAQSVLRGEEVRRDACRRVERLIERFVDRCARAEVPYGVVRKEGTAAEVMLGEAEDCDLTLLGQRTHFHVEGEEGADETLEAVLHNSHRPVVAVPLTAEQAEAVLVAYDGSPPAARALEAFQKSGIHEGQPVHVVSASRNWKEATQRAEEGARFLDFHGIPARPHPLKVGRVTAEALLAQASELDAGLVVMGAHGRSALWETFFGSLTRDVLERSESVLFLHH
jgi:nucleotide-binding universal stress UspA family protein